MTADTPDPDADHGEQTRTHKAGDPHWYSLLFGPPFKIIGFFYRSFQSNRKRLARLKGTSGAASLIKTALVLTLFLWKPSYSPHNMILVLMMKSSNKL